MPTAGFATEAGTRRYRERLGARAVAEHFRASPLGWLSSVGVGTYLGDPDAETDRRYEQALVRALELGANTIDTAINYRFQRSERTIAAALQRLFAAGRLARDEVVLSTKGGFLTFDADVPADPNEYFHQEYVRRGVITRQEDVVGGMHCMTPRYLEDQLARSLRNLGLETVDIYYLHNPEMQLPAVSREEFKTRLQAAFEALEGFVAAGKTRLYGTATWDGYRRPPGAPDFLSLAELARLAEEVAGPDHHFRVVQLPFNLAMPEALTRANQPLGEETVSFLEAAARLGITVFASASILQGQVASNLPPELRAVLDGLETDAQRALQFVRSTPGITTALVGMSRIEHVEENLALTGKPPLGRERFLQLFRSA